MIILCFGSPACGLSTALQVLKSASLSSIAVVKYEGIDSVPLAEEASKTYEIVFLDVDGGLIGPKDIQALVDAHLIGHGNGAIIRMHAFDEDCMKRAPEGYITFGDLRAFGQNVIPVEELIRTHNLSYFMIGNSDLEKTVKQLAIRSGLKK